MRMNGSPPRKTVWGGYLWRLYFQTLRYFRKSLLAMQKRSNTKLDKNKNDMNCAKDEGKLFPVYKSVEAVLSLPRVRLPSSNDFTEL